MNSSRIKLPNRQRDDPHSVIKKELLKRNQFQLKQTNIIFQDSSDKVNKSNSFIKYQNLNNASIDNSRSPLPFENNKLQLYRNHRNSFIKGKDSPLHNTTFSWNSSNYLWILNKISTKHQNFPSIIGNKNNPLNYFNNIGNHLLQSDSYIKFILNQKQSNALERLNKRGTMNPISKIDFKANRSFNIDGIIFDINTRNRNSKSPIEGLKDSPEPHMNLQNYDFNGCLKRIEKESSKGSINKSMENEEMSTYQVDSEAIKQKLSSENIEKILFPQKPTNILKNNYEKYNVNNTELRDKKSKGKNVQENNNKNIVLNKIEIEPIKKMYRNLK